MRHVLSFRLLHREVCGCSRLQRGHLISQLSGAFLQILDLGKELLQLELKSLPFPLCSIQLLLEVIDLDLMHAFLVACPSPNQIILLHYHTDIAF